MNTANMSEKCVNNALCNTSFFLYTLNHTKQHFTSKGESHGRKKVQFYEVAYEYLKDDYPANYHTVEELTRKVPLIPSPNDDTDPIGTFENSRKDLSKDLSDIMKIFGIESFSNDFKINGEYQFTQKMSPSLPILYGITARCWFGKRELSMLLITPLKSVILSSCTRNQLILLPLQKKLTGLQEDSFPCTFP